MSTKTDQIHTAINFLLLFSTKQNDSLAIEQATSSWTSEALHKLLKACRRRNNNHLFDRICASIYFWLTYFS